MLQRNAHKVIVVDDGSTIRNAIYVSLEADGMDILKVNVLEEIPRLLSDHLISLVLIDTASSKINDLEAIGSIRKISNTPIIVLTESSDVLDKIIALEVGADDYIQRPFHERELLARMHSLLRRSKNQTVEKQKIRLVANDENMLYFKNWKMDITNQILFDPDGLDVRLTNYEFIVLKALVMATGKTLTREEILNHLYPDRHAMSPLDRSLDVLIAKLRKKLRDNSQNPKFIRTVRQLGYLFIAEVA